MNHMMQHDHQQMTKSQTGHDTSVTRASHDRHAGHSVAIPSFLRSYKGVRLAEADVETGSGNGSALTVTDG